MLNHRLFLGLLLLFLVSSTASSQQTFPVPKINSPRKDVKPFKYVDAKIPFYPGGGPRKGDGKWNKMQLPLPPEESMKHIVTPVGFRVELFAAEPDIVNPICMAWDERGRLWIAESIDYPNDIQPPGKGRDRIKICEDTNNDGKADKFTIFADKLSIPTSLCFSNGGIIVHQAPQTLFLKDTDGDDRADVRKVLFEGWSTGDTHAGPSNLQYGLDNWLWGVVGYAGLRGKIGGENHRFQQGFYRFKADGSKMEFIRSTNNNTWGLGFSEEGLVFGSTANGNPSVYMPLANRYYEQVRGWSAGQLGGIADSHLFKAVTNKVRQVDFHGGYTAAAGHALYTARTYPKEYWNRTAFVCGPTGHLVGTFVLREKGTAFTSSNLFNLFASDDEWTAPIMAEVGPDGHVWVIDWYNYIVQHNPTPVGFKRGKGNAYINPLRDKKHGRIYRVVYTKAKPLPPMSLANASPKKLVQTLRHPNMLWRKHAQRLLVEREKLDVLDDLVTLAGDQSVDEIGQNPGVIHSLWTLRGLASNKEATLKLLAAADRALKHKSPGVRRNALLVLPSSRGALRLIFKNKLQKDPSPPVRMALLQVFSKFRGNLDCGMETKNLLMKAENHQDKWIRDAGVCAAAANSEYFLAGIIPYKKPFPKPVAQIVLRVAEHHARSKPKSLSFLAFLQKTQGAELIIQGLAKGWPKEHKIHLSEKASKNISELMAKVSPQTQSHLIHLAKNWGTKELERYTAEIVLLLQKQVADSKASDEARVKAAQQLITLRPEDNKVVMLILNSVTPRDSPQLVNGMIQALADSKSANAGASLVKKISQLTPGGKRTAIQVLLSRQSMTKALLQGLQKGQVRFSDLSLDQKQALNSHPSKSIASWAKNILAKGGGLPNPDRDRVLKSFLPFVKKKGDPIKGKLVFEQQCSKCHMHRGTGQQIGPDLTGMAVHSKEELLTQIIDPSRSVEGNFRIYTVMTSDGKIYNGLLAAESKTTLELIDTEAKKHVLQRNEIEELFASSKSLMPDGFEKQLSKQDMVNLLEFLTQRGKFVPLDLSKVATVVSTKGMFHSEESQAERLIFKDWSPKTFAGVPFHLVNPRGDRVPNVILMHGPLGKIPPKMPRKVSLPCNTSAKAIHFLSGVSGWGAKRPMNNGSVSLIVRLHYHEGDKEDHPLINGQHFADYIGRYDVPKSEFAFALRRQQMRYLAIHPKRDAVIKKIELVKGNDRTAPIIMAVTVETGKNK